jgi:hypothetical protein
MSERDYLAKEEALRRLSEPEGDHELHTALERMRIHHPHRHPLPSPVAVEDFRRQTHRMRPDYQQAEQ